MWNANSPNSELRGEGLDGSDPGSPAALMLGSDRSRGYCLEMICADLLRPFRNVAQWISL